MKYTLFAGDILAITFFSSCSGGKPKVDPIAARLDSIQKAELHDALASLDANMVTVTGGTFVMGLAEDTSIGPLHKVTLSSFKLNKYVVTQSFWEGVMGSNPSEQTCGNCPVYQVSYNDVLQFINKLNSLTHKKYRLPTNAEWEYAARGGNISKHYVYCGSNEVDSVVYHDTSAVAKIRPIGQKKPNELGIYDMTNVREWCFDWYNDNRYDFGPANNPHGPETGKMRCVRGSMVYPLCRVGFCYYAYPDAKESDITFRLAEDM